MANTTKNNFGNKLPPVKTGQRFGEENQNNKKVGLFSERRFLIFTKRGPFEIAFKPIHYTSAIITAVVGLTSIIYWSAMGIYSAIDVAKKDIITEASANINEPIENDSDTLDNFSSLRESNISFPVLKTNMIKNNYEVLELEDFEKKQKNYNNNQSQKNTNIEVKNNIKSKKITRDVKNEISKSNEIEFIPKVNISGMNKYKLLDKKKLPNKVILKEDPDLYDSFYNDEIDSAFNDYPIAPKLDKKAKNYRFIASVDNELTLMENVFKVINVKINNSDLINVENLLKNKPNIDPDSDEFFTNLKDRLNLLAIYKDALQFIPLKPPMEHYYISSQYGKRKHPVTGKYRMHHGIDLAGTWQEDISVSADGTVVFAGYHGSFGKVIRIKHNYGIITTYGHLAKIKVKKGDIVNEGKVIGKMGRTGRVNGAHLHYEISVNGKSQNPNTYIKIGRNLLSRTSLKTIAKIK